MDGLKEIFETLGSRIKSQITGSISLTFFACNWKPLFYIAFSKKPLETRFSFFDQQTSIFSLLILPVALGLMLAIILPWLTYCGARLSETPYRKKKILQVKSANQVLILKQEFEHKRKRLLATKEEILIDQAKRNQEVSSIEDKDERNRLQSQIEALRKEFDAQVDENIKPDTSITQLEVIQKRIEILRDQQQSFEADQNWEAAQEIGKAILKEVSKLTA